MKSNDKTLKLTAEATSNKQCRSSTSDVDSSYKSNSNTKIHQQESSETSDIVGVELFALVCGLFALIYLFELANRSMTNFISKILGGERRRSVASSLSSHSSSHQQQQGGDQIEYNRNNQHQAQYHGSTLSLPRGSQAESRQQENHSPALQRRSSRSSIHSLSAFILGAFTGGQSSQATTTSSSTMSQQQRANGNAFSSALLDQIFRYQIE